MTQCGHHWLRQTDKSADRPEWACSKCGEYHFGKLPKNTLARAAGMLCGNPKFQTWVGVNDAHKAADYLRKYCGIDSRSQLDTDERAAKLFHQLRRQFLAHQYGE